VKSRLKEEYVIENIVVGQMIIKESLIVNIIVKLNLNIDVKIIQNMLWGICKWLGTWQIFQQL